MLILVLWLSSLAGCSDDPPSGGRDLGFSGDGPRFRLDAGASDATSIDAGPVDNGIPGGLDQGGATDAGDGTDTGLPRADSGTDLGADFGAQDFGPPDFGAPDLGPADLGAPDLGPPDSGPPDLGPLDAGPAPVTCTEPGLVLQTITDSASSGTPDTYFFDVNPGDPFCAEITGGGSGTWGVTVSNGTSGGIYCDNITPCRFRIPAGEMTILVTALTSDIGGYTLRVRSIPR